MQYGEKTVLVVEDDSVVAELIQQTLISHHYQVLLAHDGLEAMQQTNYHHVDLIVMDTRQPYFSGFWFCQAFRRKKNTRNIPIVLVSAVVDDENDRKARLAGAASTVKRSFTSEELLEVVEKNSL